MSIYVWTSEIKNIYVWTTPVKEVYVWTTKVRPTWWWTLAQWLWVFRPLREDANDHKLDVWWTWTVSNASWTWTASYTTAWWIQSAHFNHSYNSWSYITSSYLRKDIPITIACWIYADGWHNTWQTILSTQDTYNDGDNKKIWIWLADNWPRITFSYWVWDWPYQTVSIWVWLYVACSISSDGTWRWYIDSTAYNWTWWVSMTFNKRWQVWNWGSNGFYWNIRDVAIWERALSDSEILNYKSKTSS